MEIITTEVAATRLNISVQRVRQLIKELEIEVQTIGKAIILTDADLRQLKKRNQRKGRPKAAGK